MRGEAVAFAVVFGNSKDVVAVDSREGIDTIGSTVAGRYFSMYHEPTTAAEIARKADAVTILAMEPVPSLSGRFPTFVPVIPVSR
ncbi:MAG: hypothetical protein ABT940_11285, partial [Alphaproteobacteria bacterium]